jgi:hypothetical protein
MSFTTPLQIAQTILLPKGRNRGAATEWLSGQGIRVPDLPGRRLHRR